MHEEGLGTGVNLYTSFYWYEKSAKLNHPTAQYHLAQFYEMGKGTHKDLKRAKLWYQRSAQNGDKNAKIRLAHKSPSPQIDSDKKPKKINSTDALKDAIDSDNEPRDINPNEKDPTSSSEEDNESIVDMLMFWR
jgi:TPR repeat protein